MVFVPITSHTGMGIAEAIITFLQKKPVDIKY